MSWWLVVGLGAVSLTLRGVGFALPPGRELSERTDRRVHLVAIALLGAVIATQALTTQGRITPDARAGGLAVALIAGWRQCSMLVTCVLAVVTTAALRALFG